MVAYIMNTIDRSRITPEITEHNLKGLQDINLIVSDNGSTEKEVRQWAQDRADVFLDNQTNIGNPQALNNGIAVGMALGCDYFVIAGNDIRLKQGWLKESLRAFHQDEQLGLLGYDWRNTKGKEQKGLIDYCDTIFGTWMMPRKTIEKCGYFSTFSKYGLWDSEFHMRVTANGFTKGYLNGFDSEHKCNDVQQKTDYRRMKDQELQKAKPNNQRIKDGVKYVDRLNIETKD